VALIAVVGCCVCLPTGCGGGETARDSPTVARPHKAEDVKAALEAAGVEFLETLSGDDLVPPELGRAKLQATLLSGAIRDSQGYRYGVIVTVYQSAATANRELKALHGNPDGLGYLTRRFGNVLVAVHELGTALAPARLPPGIARAMSELRTPRVS